MVRYLFLLHRYLGMGIGLILFLWSVSGIVMMYKHFPELSLSDELALLEPLAFERCCDVGSLHVLDREFTTARLEMHNGVPTLRLTTVSGQYLQYDFSAGMFANDISQAVAQEIANRYIERKIEFDAAVFESTIHNDQWTVYSAYNRHRPLHKFVINDKAGSEFYISSSSGEIVQWTNAEQRFWAYVGPVVHWLYPTALRQNTALWGQVVIWLSVVGIFLVSTGLYAGIRQFKKRRSGRLSPYRGIGQYHHYFGLVFGVITLAWVVSGLLSMNPWGLLEGEGTGTESRRLQQNNLDLNVLASTMQAEKLNRLSSETVRLEFTMLAGKLSVTSFRMDGSSVHLAPDTFKPEPLSAQILSVLAAQIQPDQPVVSAQLIDIGDAYYYPHHESVELPIYRVVVGQEQQRSYYLSPISGKIVYKVDENVRWYRWLAVGLHRGDFTALLRSRPLWDVFMLVLLLGVSFLCGTGTILAARRLRR